jgi:hypothetical protein
MWKEADVDHFKEISRYLPEETEENNGNYLEGTEDFRTEI